MFITKCPRANNEFLNSPLSLLQKRFYFRDFPNTSINTNTQDISVHYISTSTSSKYHRSPPQSIFKSWHFPYADISAELSSQAEQQDKWWLSLLACVVNHHRSFRCQVWFSTCWLSWFLRPVSHILSLSVIICLDVHWCRVPAQVQNNTVCLMGTSRWEKATACVRSVLQLYPRTGCYMFESISLIHYKTHFLKWVTINSVKWFG